MARAKKSNKEKVQAEYPDFVEETQGLTIDQLEKKIGVYAKEQEKAVKFKEEDTALNDAKEQVKELSGPHRDVAKALKLKIRFMCELVKEKGGDA